MLDLEIGAIRAFEEVFPNVLINHCLFHLSQAVFRKVEAMGLMHDYSNNAEFKISVRSPPALALLRPEEVHDAFNILQQNFPAIANRVFDYFKSTYVVRYRHDEIVEPPFPILSWNAHQAVVNDGQRTNNAIEGWHRQFRKRFLNDHAALSKFIEQIKEEEQLMDNRI